MIRTTTGTGLADRFAARGLDWIVPDWTVPEGVHAFATTRRGGVSAGARATMNLGRNVGDDAHALAENRRRLEFFLPASPTWLSQVHGADVAVLAAGSPRAPSPVADAAITRDPGVVCTILTADCLPVLFADRRGGAVGIAHAGWRGLAAGVLEATISALGDLDVASDDVLAWLGPAIGPDRFEVGADVRDRFCADDPASEASFVPQRRGKWHADLYALARARLARAGVSRVTGGGHCTHSDATRFFSYRRERDTGRMATAIWLSRD